jgi:hypothetical protein
MSRNLALLVGFMVVDKIQATDGTCYNYNCGCPGSFKENWCTESNSYVSSSWCQESSSNCQNNCGGAWCAEAEEDDTPLEGCVEGGCYISECGCPGSYLQTWCESSTTLVQSDWCQEQENRCTTNCGGTWCAGTCDGDSSSGDDGTSGDTSGEDDGSSGNTSGEDDGSSGNTGGEDDGSSAATGGEEDDGSSGNTGGEDDGSSGNTGGEDDGSSGNTGGEDDEEDDTGSGGGGGGSRTCFSGDDKATLQSGEHIKFSKLKIGDSILSSTRDGKVSFSKVVFLPHGENDTPTKFLEIVTESKKTVKMTAGHLVQLCSGKLVTAHELTVRPAARHHSEEELEVESDARNSCLRTVHGDEKITSIQQVESKGVYTAVTENEFLVVNGIIASPFASSAILAHAYFNLTDMEDWCSTHNWMVHENKKQGQGGGILDVLHQYKTLVVPSEDCMTLLTGMFEEFKDEPIGWGVDGWGYRGWANPASAAADRKKKSTTTATTAAPQGRGGMVRDAGKKKDDGDVVGAEHRALRGNHRQKLSHKLPIPVMIAGWKSNNADP